MLSSSAYSVVKDRSEMLDEEIEALMLQSKAFSRLKDFEPAVATAFLGRQLSVQTNDANLLSQTDDQAAELAEMMGVREYMRLETSVRDKAEIILESRVAQLTESTSLSKR